MEDTGGELLAAVVVGNSLGSDDRLGVLLKSEVVGLLVLSSGGVETTVLATEIGGDTTNGLKFVATVVELATREMLVESKSMSTAGRDLGDVH